MNLSRSVRNVSAATVATVAAIASYSHMRDLAAVNGQSEILSHLMPISVDGMLLVSTMVMVDDRANGRTPRMSSKVSLVVGVAASIVANVLAAPADPLARTISAWPAVALLLVVEMLSRTGKPSPVVTPAEHAAQPQPVAAPTATPTAASRRPRQPRRVKVRHDNAQKARDMWHDGQRDLADIATVLGVSKRSVERYTVDLRQPVAA